jgi:hypothetical protein
MKEEEKRLEEISASIRRYYDSLTDEEVAENLAWGEFAAAQFAREDGSDEWQSNPAHVSGEQSTEHGRLPISRPSPKD